MTNDFMNIWGPQRNYAGISQNVSGYQGMPQAQPMQPSLVNKIYVASFEEAYNRPIQNNSIIDYMLQDESKLIEIYADSYGRKGYKIFNLSPQKEEKKEEVQYVPLAEFKKFEEEIREKLGKEANKEASV